MQCPGLRKFKAQIIRVHLRQLWSRKPLPLLLHVAYQIHMCVAAFALKTPEATHVRHVGLDSRPFSVEQCFRRWRKSLVLSHSQPKLALVEVVILYLRECVDLFPPGQLEHPARPGLLGGKSSP
jgi:hypothetical protein